MGLIEVLRAVGSAAGFAALVTACFNLWSLRVQHRRLLAVEDLKKSTALETFRYTKLYEAIAEMQGWPPVNYDLGDMKRVVTETTDRYGKVLALATRVGPLVDPAKMARTRDLMREEECLSKAILEHLYGQGKDVPLKPLLLKRQEVEQSLLDAMSSSVSALTLRSSGRQPAAA